MSGSLVLSHVSLDQFVADMIKNGVPGAEALNSDFVDFNGQVSAPPAPAVIGLSNGASGSVKLDNNYDYLLCEIRVSGSFGTGLSEAPGGPAAGNVPWSQAARISFQLTADGRSRPVFRAPKLFSQFVGMTGPIPMSLPAPVLFGGAETLICSVTLATNYAGAVLLDFGISFGFAMVRAGAIKELAKRLARQKKPVAKKR